MILVILEGHFIHTVATYRCSKLLRSHALIILLLVLKNIILLPLGDIKLIVLVMESIFLVVSLILWIVAFVHIERSQAGMTVAMYHSVSLLLQIDTCTPQSLRDGLISAAFVMSIISFICIVLVTIIWVTVLVLYRYKKKDKQNVHNDNIIIEESDTVSYIIVSHVSTNVMANNN